MKLPARGIAIVLWVLAISLVAEQWFTTQQFVRASGSADDTTYLVVRLGNGITYFTALLALGAIVWLLGEIRDRLPERRVAQA